jgi:hypothetical protein
MMSLKVNVISKRLSRIRNPLLFTIDALSIDNPQIGVEEKY